MKRSFRKEAISSPVEIKTGNIAKRKNLLNNRDMVLVLAVKHGWQYLRDMVKIRTPGPKTEKVVIL